MANTNNNIDFIGIGSAKCGSTWLSECLNDHPDILFSAQKSRKGLMFFQKKGYLLDRFSNYNKGIDWYLNQFLDAERNKIRGEYCVDYFTDLYSPRLIKKSFPNIKLILALRNPTEMVYSLYWYLKAFSSANINIEMPNTFEEVFSSKDVQNFLLKKALYSKHLTNWLKYFPKNQIHIVIFDDIKSKPKGVISDLYNYLGVEKNYLPEQLTKKVNAAPTPKSTTVQKYVSNTLELMRSAGIGDVADYLTWNRTLQKIYTLNIKRSKYKPIDMKSRKKLVSYYKSDILKLEKMINRNLKAWLR